MRKIRKNVIVTILILTLGASTALLAYLHFFAADDRRLSGEWTGEESAERLQSMKGQDHEGQQQRSRITVPAPQGNSCSGAGV